MPKSPLGRISAILFFLGLFTCTWDKLLTFDTFGFTLKIHQLFFFCSFCLSLFRMRKEMTSRSLTKLTSPFPAALLCLSLYYALTSPWSTFPLKSALYSGWLIFNLFTIWFSAALLAKDVKKSTFLLAVIIAAVGQSAIVLIDHVAYFSGYTGGIIGFNQDAVLKWGTSRPHAFSSEPSYLSSFLTFSFLLMYAAFLAGNNRKKVFLAVSLLVTAIALIAVTSRTGWIASLLGALVLVLLDGLFKKIFPWKKICALAASLVLAVSIFYVSTPNDQLSRLKDTLIAKYFRGQDGPSIARLEAHKYALQIAEETHWLGSGLGASYKYWTSTREIDDPYIEKNFSQKSYGNELIMSVWGQLLAEGGLPAVLLYISAGYFMLATLIKSLRKKFEYLSLGALVSATVYFCFVAFFLGNVARGDIWIWFAIWSRMAMPDALLTGEKLAAQS